MVVNTLVWPQETHQLRYLGGHCQRNQICIGCYKCLYSRYDTVYCCVYMSYLYHIFTYVLYHILNMYVCKYVISCECTLCLYLAVHYITCTYHSNRSNTLTYLLKYPLPLIQHSTKQRPKTAVPLSFLFSLFRDRALSSSCSCPILERRHDVVCRSKKKMCVLYVMFAHNDHL